MTHIAVNTRFLSPNKLEGFGHYTHEILKRITQQHPEDLFDFYSDQALDASFLYAKNVRPISLLPPARHPILFYLWNQWSLRRELKRNAPDVFFSPDSFMPLGMQIPSVITVHDVAHQVYPEGISWSQKKYYDFFMPKFIHEAKEIITVSGFSKAEILRYYSVSPEKIHVIHNGIGAEYQPLSEEQQQPIRDQYTGGKPYFLFVGAIHPRKNVARLIDAYTKYRIETQHEINLVIAGRKSWQYADVDEAIAKSPFQQDILITGYVPAGMLGQLTASAYAMVYISLYEGFGLPVAESMACGVPVVVAENSAHAEVAGDAAIAVNPKNIESIVQGMIRVNDPQARQSLSLAGLERSKSFSWDEAATATYKLLVTASI